MSGREWKPGDVARIPFVRGLIVSMYTDEGWVVSDSPDIRPNRRYLGPRPLVVIDPEDRQQVEALRDLWDDAHEDQQGHRPSQSAKGARGNALQAALREFADPKPAEPTDPKAHVIDRRENIWRLLADGAWVCTSGPDVGEHLVWSRLTAERGPLSIEAES